MDTQRFLGITEDAFDLVVAACAAHITVGKDVNHDHLVKALQHEFENQAMLEVSVFDSIKLALATLFPKSTLDLDNAAVPKVLDQWMESFQDVVYLDTKLKIWRFMTPTIGMNELVYIIHTHIIEREAIENPLFVVLTPDETRERVDKEYKVVAPRPGVGQKRPREDENFYHVCPYCNDIDTNRRPDHVKDHVWSHHGSSMPGQDTSLADSRDTKLLKRMTVHVLRERIRNERWMVNCFRERLRLIRRSMAELEGREVGEFIDDVDVESGLYSRKDERTNLARILRRERLAGKSVDTWEEEICKEINPVWVKALGQELEQFDWDWK